MTPSSVSGTPSSVSGTPSSVLGTPSSVLGIKSPFFPPLRDLAILLAIHAFGYVLLGQFRLLDQLLSPSGDSSVAAIAPAIIFLLVRLFLILFAPGWILARLYLAWVTEQPDEKDRKTSLFGGLQKGIKTEKENGSKGGIGGIS